MTADTPRGVYAHRGEEVVCATHGHVICEVGRDILVGELPGPDAFTNWRQAPPVKRTGHARCTICRGYWFHRAPAKLRFKDGWR